MGHAQQLRDLLAPLGVYRWEGTFQWGELQSQGAEELADTQQEMHLTTAQGEGLDRILSLLGRERGEASVEDLRATAAALLRIGGGSFTLAAMNDTLRGCGLPARVERCWGLRWGGSQVRLRRGLRPPGPGFSSSSRDRARISGRPAK